MRSDSWSREEMKLLEVLFPTVPTRKLLEKFPGRSFKAINSRAKIQKLLKNYRNRKQWTVAEDSRFKAEYPNRPNRELSEMFGTTVCSVNKRRAVLRLHKNPEYMAKCLRECGKQIAAHPRSIAARILPGSVPVNKGVRRPGWFSGRMRETQFKKGEKSRNWMPLGSTRVNAAGYLDRKVLDTGYPPRDWRGEHLLIWEAMHGAVPAGCAVVFRDGNKTNIVLENLEILTRAELMRRNSIHARRSPEIKEAIYALISVKSKITRMEKKKLCQREI